MRKIFKYKMEFSGIMEVALPVGAMIVDMGFQNPEELCVWALVDPDETQTDLFRFRCFGTGHPLDESELEHLQHAKTLHVGDFVWHIFIDVGLETK